MGEGRAVPRALLGPLALAATLALAGCAETGSVATAPIGAEEVAAEAAQAPKVSLEQPALVPLFDSASVPSFDSEAAPDDGAVGLWAEGYYIVHSYAPEGQAVLSMQEGDAFEIDGVTHEVEGVLTISQFAQLGEVYEAAGSDRYTFLQTCVPDSDWVRVVYGK